MTGHASTNAGSEYASDLRSMTTLQSCGAGLSTLDPVSLAVHAAWTRGLPTLRGHRMMVRELRKSDAASLFTMMTTDEVAQFISSPPASPSGFEKFIQWAIRERRTGKQLTFGIVPEGCHHAVGLVQVRGTAPGFSAAEWGFALGSPFWGTGLFLTSAKLVLDFAFDHTAVKRMEARAATENVRGNAVLRKLGAVQEGVIRGSLLKDGERLDQIVWSIESRDW